jgi:hypothetical protein
METENVVEATNWLNSQQLTLISGSSIGGKTSVVVDLVEQILQGHAQVFVPLP